jgi:hypothetical protein
MAFIGLPCPKKIAGVGVAEGSLLVTRLASSIGDRALGARSSGRALGMDTPYNPRQGRGKPHENPPPATLPPVLTLCV